MKKSSRDRRVENRFYKNRANYSHLRSCDNCIYRLVESHDATWATESTLEFYCDNPKRAYLLHKGEMMKYIFDTKYIEHKTSIDLISVGIVCEDGREFYAINEDCNFSKATGWTLENVLAPIGITLDGKQVVYFADASCDINLYGMSKNDIKKLVLDFVGNKQPECWTSWAEYNWDIFCQALDLDIPLF